MQTRKSPINQYCPSCWKRHHRLVALARLGVFSVDLVERVLLDDEGEDMPLLLAKAAGCAWTTARELLLMYAANRSLKPDDITLTFERYKKLSQQTREILSFSMSGA